MVHDQPGKPNNSDRIAFACSTVIFPVTTPTVRNNSAGRKYPTGSRVGDTGGCGAGDTAVDGGEMDDTVGGGFAASKRSSLSACS